jgi:hypothetical protein
MLIASVTLLWVFAVHVGWCTVRKSLTASIPLAILRPLAESLAGDGETWKCAFHMMVS